MPKEAVGCESGLVAQVEALTGEKWESISHHLSEKAVILLTQSDSDPVGFLVIDTEVKEDTFLYIKRMEIGKGLGHEELEKLADHILSQALDQAREMGFSQLLVEEDRLPILDLLCRHGFHEWRRDLVMEIGLGAILEIETDTQICVETVLGDVDALVKTWNDIVALNPGSFIDFPPTTVEYMKAKLSQPEAGLDPGGWFIASLHGRRCGLLTANKYGEIGDLMVAVWARRKGVGTALLISALAYLKEKRLGKAKVTLREENAPAIGLYSKIGFMTTSARVSLAAQTKMSDER